jgi:acetyl-CoA C-acetyltransferase
MPVNPRTPVLIGYGQMNYRETEEPENTPEPVDLMV